MDNRSAANVVIDKDILSLLNKQLEERQQPLQAALTCAVKLWLDLPLRTQETLLSGKSVDINMKDIIRELAMDMEKNFGI